MEVMVTATVDTQTKVTATAVVIMGTAIATTRVTTATATVVGATVTATIRRVEIAKSCRYRHQKVVLSIKLVFLCSVTDPAVECGSGRAT
jgi:hypothetical protein